MGILRISLATLTSGCSLWGCSQKLEKMPSVPFCVYSLPEKGIEWSELEYPHDDEIIVINDYAKLGAFLGNADACSLPNIDFARHTLLLARGVTPYDSHAAIRNLQYLPDRNYVMNIDLAPNLATVITNWHVAIIIPKLEDDAKVLLHVHKTGLQSASEKL